jgi:hypothetical protein
MMEETPQTSNASTQALMDEMLRAGIPEIKLALGDAIDRENARPLPPKYARLLPDTLLIVTLRPDAADALSAIAPDVERELTDSCNRHGSLYDRSYRVRLTRSEDLDAPLFVVTAQAGRDVAEPAPEERQQSTATEARPSPLPPTAPSATPAGEGRLAGWEPGRWLLVVEDDQGKELEAFRLAEPYFTVGRSTDDPQHRASIAISDAPHVSRRQLALVWEERDGAPGFKVYNLGLNSVHLPGHEVPGSRSGKGNVDLAMVPDVHTGWLPPGVPLRIGDHGPTLRINEVPEGPEDVWIDPDATVFE